MSNGKEELLSCEKASEIIFLCVEGESSKNDEQLLYKHMETCEKCRKEYKAQIDIKQKISEAVIIPEKQLKEEVLKKICIKKPFYKKISVISSVAAVFVVALFINLWYNINYNGLFLGKGDTGGDLGGISGEQNDISAGSNGNNDGSTAVKPGSQLSQSEYDKYKTIGLKANENAYVVCGVSKEQFKTIMDTYGSYVTTKEVQDHRVIVLPYLQDDLYGIESLYIVIQENSSLEQKKVVFFEIE